MKRINTPILYSILFVCLGNICRSPAAAAILKQQLKQYPHLYKCVHIESCGIGDWHVGQLPDMRMRKAAEKRDLILYSRAQQFQHSFFHRFHYIFAADQTILNALQQQNTDVPPHDKIFLINHFNLQQIERDIPDPYFDNADGFEFVLNMLENACLGIILHLEEEYQKLLT